MFETSKFTPNVFLQKVLPDEESFESYRCQHSLFLQAFFMKDNHTCNLGQYSQQHKIIVTLKLNIYCLFCLAADSPINASLSKSKS